MLINNIYFLYRCFPIILWSFQYFVGLSGKSRYRFLCVQAAMALKRLHVCAGFTKPSLLIYRALYACSMTCTVRFVNNLSFGPSLLFFLLKCKTGESSIVTLLTKTMYMASGPCDLLHISSFRDFVWCRPSDIVRK